MVYILLDTNIIIDMVVDRRNTVINHDLLNTFINLINYDEVKIILPSVVKTETYRNLDDEFNKVKKNIDSVMKAIDDLYGVSTQNIPALDISEYKKKARLELYNVQVQFDKNKEAYLKDIKLVINNLFSHRNTIFLDDEVLMSKIQKRRVHKRAPFHKEAKESYGDAAIIETIINIKEYIDVSIDDTLYFVTGNFKDFSDPDNKDLLHPDIIEDIDKADLSSNVVYLRTFGNLINPHLKQYIENADMVKEFEYEMEEEKKSIYREFEENLRESVGLTALGKIAEKTIADFSDSNFATDISEYFERINIAYSELEDLYFYYDEEFVIDDIDCNDLITKMSKVINQEMTPIAGNLKLILEWIRNQKEECRELEICLPDNISFGDIIELQNINRESIYLKIGSIDCITPENGGSDLIDISIVDSMGNTLAIGDIEILYGFINFDSDGNVGDGCDESTNYRTDEIIDYIKSLCLQWENFIIEKKQIADKIRLLFEE
ncbi:PIN domain-containing protein [Ruminococcus albus]|uniref:DUF4935 domain-containing protein n=1 Tax=Ruminococcus albus TaxID=1264 RepID=A0A1I1RMB1_RUMAL|nr:PIN domain-containing protein [Ruminococcus albus]SFD31550.1 hypothetical protein SAMN02910406_03646 [Ruminococcus albus]